jgi:ankyrin repeat protein
VASERLDLVRLMVEYGADVNLKDSKARTPLMRAAHLNRRDLIAFLLDAHADPLAVDASGHLALHYLLAHPATPDTEAAVQLLVSRQLTEIQRMPVAYDLLAWATQHQAMQLLNYLLDNQFDPNVEIAQRPSILEIAVSTKSDRLITRLLQAGAGNLKRNDLLKAAFWAIQEDRLTILAHCLKRGLEADATPAATPDAPTLLLTACQYNRKACIETLIHANARLENTLQGHVAVAWAVENGEAALLKLALQHGAPAHVLYNTAIDGWVPIKELEHKPGETALIRACRLRQATCALEFVRAGATKASAQSGDFALMYAVTDGHLSLVKELLEAGVSPKLMDTNHRMVAKIARSKGHREIYQLLRAAGAPLHSPFETQRFIAFGLWGLYLVIAAVVGFYLYDHHDYITLLGLCVVSLVVYQALSALWKKPR